LNGKTFLEYLTPREPPKSELPQAPLLPEETTSNVFAEIFSTEREKGSLIILVLIISNYLLNASWNLIMENSFNCRGNFNRRAQRETQQGHRNPECGIARPAPSEQAL